MEVEEPLNCKNCGAVLSDSTDNKIKCTYCGTIYRENAQVKSNSPNAGHSELVNNMPRPVESRRDNSNNSAAGGIFVIIVAAIILFIIVIYAKNSSQGSSNYDDSTAVDTSQLFLRPQPDKLADTEQASLKLLAGLKVDRPQFLKIYKDSSVVTKDLALQTAYVTDKNSIAGKPESGLFTEIDYGDIGYNIFLGSQHIGKKALVLQSLTFIINGKRIRYEPSISTDSLGHFINEHSDEVINHDKISMLLKLATANKVIIRFNDSKAHNQMVLPKKQQQSLARQLKLYKGLLLGYAKQ